MDLVFNKVDLPLQSIILDIEIGKIGLPDLQRPFVWKNPNVRDLLDSMYRGLPVGYLIFWEPTPDTIQKTIGENLKQRSPKMLIVDGQQRLTSLFAVFTGTSIVREDYKTETIQIAFNPLLEKFEVADAAIRNDNSFLSNISVLWEATADLFEIVDEYIAKLSNIQELDKDKIKQIRNAVNKLSNLKNYPFTALELLPTVDEEQVAEVFVRINSKGKNIKQANFILTLMSVFWDEGRKKLENFCRLAKNTPSLDEDSPFNYLIDPTPDLLLRVSVALAFRRARLKYVYSLLRGKDLKSGEFSTESRETQFKKLKQAQDHVLDLEHWHDFIKIIHDAGFKSSKMISSKTNLFYAYVFYLLGKTEFNVEENELHRLIGHWFFVTALTGRYSGLSESLMESDLARLVEVRDATEFTQVLNNICSNITTTDYWDITLPNNLAISASQSPSMFGYYAALNLLNAKALYSNKLVAEVVDPSNVGKQTAIERRRLFPQNYLKSIGVSANAEINQIANFTISEFNSDEAPFEYVPSIEAKFSAEELEQMYYWHALPQNWPTMSYHKFLNRRRTLMARVIKKAYEKSFLDDEKAVDQTQQVNVGELIAEGETETTEFKGTLRTNLHTNQKDAKMEFAVLRTIAGFLNSRGGGTLVIGIGDDGSTIGIDVDNFPSEDKIHQHLINLIDENFELGKIINLIHSRFEDYEEERIFVIDCKPANSPVFIKLKNKEQPFFIRAGTTTRELKGSDQLEFIRQRFPEF